MLSLDTIAANISHVVLLGALYFVRIACADDLERTHTLRPATTIGIVDVNRGRGLIKANKKELD